MHEQQKNKNKILHVTIKLHKQIVHHVRFTVDKTENYEVIACLSLYKSVLQDRKISYVVRGHHVIPCCLVPFVVFCTLIHCKISVNLEINELEPGTATCDLFQGGPATSFLRFDKPQLFTRDYFGCKP